VISGTHSAADVLAALDLADDAGVRLSLVSLFETNEDLRAAAAGEAEREQVRRPLFRTIAGIAAALRNTG
jgi:phosphoenolpyruvate carboxylase